MAVLADSDVAASHLGQFHATWLSTGNGFTLRGLARLIDRLNSSSPITLEPCCSPNSAYNHSFVHRFKDLCFSANSTSFRSTNIPFRSRTPSTYAFAIFDRSAFSPRSSSSSSVVGTQNGSRSNSSYLGSAMNRRREDRDIWEHTR